MKYLVKQYELFPGLDLIPLYAYNDTPDIKAIIEKETEEIPAFLVSDWKRAKKDLHEAEDAIRGYLKTGLH